MGGAILAIWCVVSALAVPRVVTSTDLFMLAVDHRAQAERSTCETEQVALHRVADIYAILATMDMPLETVARLTEI